MAAQMTERDKAHRDLVQAVDALHAARERLEQARREETALRNVVAEAAKARDVAFNAYEAALGIGVERR